jgi:pilus assembly protein TadC
MKVETKDFIKESIEKINVKAKCYSEKESNKLGISYLRNALEKLLPTLTVDVEIEEIKEKIIKLIDLLPNKPANEPIRARDYRQYIKAHGKLQTYIKGKYNLTREGYYTSVYLILGIVIGTAISIPLFHIIKGTGLLIGIVIGLIVGSRMDHKAKQERRTL